MDEGLQGGSCARRGLLKAFDEVSARSDNGGFDRSSANVNTNRQRFLRIGANDFFGHDRLCIIPSLCNSTERYVEAKRSDAGATLPLPAAKELITSVQDSAPSSTVPGKRAGLAFFDRALNLLLDLKRTQADVIQKASEVCADRIARGGLVFLFGNGHSRMMCEEMTPRQGGYAGFVALVEAALSNHSAIVGANGLRAPLFLENYEGYAEQILRSFHFGPHDAFIIISTSGIRPAIVEMAMGAQSRGLKVIAIVSKAHCEGTKAAHSSGKKLTDCADLVIDNLCPPGDCVLELEGLEWRTGPVSTITGAMIINMIRCATAEALLERGVKPVILPSHQFVGNASASEQLEAFYEAYRRSLKHLFE
jgi:uncharacterized phosphosugar-binding protein